MKPQVHSHRSAAEVVPRQVQDEVFAAIPGKPAVLRATACRDAFLRHLRSGCGWSDEVTVSTDAKITITACKGGIGLCLQTGNMARFYADLMKLSLLHTQGRITAGVFVVPVHALAKVWGSNIANYERLYNELGVFYPILNVPILAVGITKS